MPVLPTTPFHQHARDHNIDHRQDACSTNNPIPPTCPFQAKSSRFPTPDSRFPVLYNSH
ncbi:hypothetical protein [Moorena producens]|uniref:hypothetical protein n=1 Tax=Moorena producens TaxID=1155739 RepID=UPI003C766C06